ncbi:MAG: RNA polymerase sigma factor [Flavobacteriales bacterium]|nr:RNA polymerase sigma factor [Flavobacteriales bacterium]
MIPVCWRYATSREQAVEYFNQGFLKIIVNLDKYKTKVPFELWCRRVMINTIIDEYRKVRQYKESIELKAREEMAQMQPQEKTLSDSQEEMLDLIKSKMGFLPPVTSKVFNLYAIDGYKHHEIASLLNISEGTSMWHYSVAKKKIREMIKESVQADQLNERAS